MNTSIKDILTQAKRDNIKGYFITAFVVLILIGAVFTGYHTYSLFYRGLGSGVAAAILAAIPVLLLEGTILAILGASFYYFTTPAQKDFASLVSWAGLAILSVNTVIDHNLNTKTEIPYALTVYATLMLPAIPIAAFACIKHLLSLDPRLKEHEANAMAEEALRNKIREARINAYDSEAVTNALVTRSQLDAETLSHAIITGQLSLHGPQQPDAARQPRTPLALPTAPTIRLNAAAAALTTATKQTPHYSPEEEITTKNNHASEPTTAPNFSPSSHRKTILESQLAQLIHDNQHQSTHAAQAEISKIKGELSALEKIISKNSQSTTQPLNPPQTPNA